MNKCVCIILLLAILLAIPVSSRGELPRIVFTVSDTTALTGSGDGWLSINIDNYFDTLFGFQFVIRSSRPDLVTFDFTNQGFDTTNTLVSGWEYMQGLDLDGDQSAYWFRCIADVPLNLITTDGFGPQQGGVAVRIRYNVPDSLPADTEVIKSLMTVDTPFDFSDPYGNSIGTVVDTTVDTNYWHCNAMQADSCTEWLPVDSGSTLVDSVSIDTTRIGYLDTTQVIAINGSVSVRSRLVCDNDNSGNITINDLTCLVDFMFSELPPICSDVYCDPNGNGIIDISDLTILVTYMFDNGPPP